MSVIDAPVNTREAWSRRASVCEQPWDAAGWSKDGQLERHARVIAALDPRPFESLLDWGCGTGELLRSLSNAVPAVSYVGYDWSPGMLERARASFPWPNARFVDRLAGQFDLVACVGPFNLPDGWSKQHTWHAIRHLWDSTNCRAIAVSLYAGDDTNCLSYTADEALRCGRDLGYGSVIERIRHNDLLLVARR